MTYEYLCTECGHAWEEEQSISASPTETCPTCGRKSAKRQVSGGVGFILKGGGWYADGYGSGSPKKGADSSAEKTGSSGQGSGSTGSGTKTETATSDSKSGDSKSGDSKGDSGKGGGASGDSAASPPA
jgi:putative FmdB family regulatory protein